MVEEEVQKTNFQQDETYLLEPTEIVEWSIVDRPAIEEEWLIVKRKESQMPTKALQEKVVEAVSSLNEALKHAKEGSKEEKRLKLVIANLKGLVSGYGDYGQKTEKSQADGDKDDEDVEKQLEEMTEQEPESEPESDDEVEKAGRKLSKATQKQISDIVQSLNGVLDSLRKLLSDEPRSVSKSLEDDVDLTEITSSVLNAYKEGLLDQKEITKFAKILTDLEG